MKHLYKRIIIIALCVSISFCVMSCEISFPIETADTTEATEEATSAEKNTFSFETVNDLLIAIKRNPSNYGNEKITVKGTILKKNDHTAICDLSDVADLSPSLEFDVEEYSIYRKYKGNNLCMDIVFYDDLSHSVVTTGDYVELCGTVKVSNGEVILDNCECEIIKFASERK